MANDVYPPALVKATLEAKHPLPRNKLLQFCHGMDATALMKAVKIAIKPGESLLLVGVSPEEPLLGWLDEVDYGSLVWINDVPPPPSLAAKVKTWVITDNTNATLSLLFSK